MRFPSVRLIGEQLRAVALRFPLVILAALTATVGAVLAFDGASSWSIESRLALAGGLGLPTFVALTLYSERWPHRLGRLLAPAVVLALLAAFVVAWPHWTEQVGFRRYLQLTLAAHLLASFVPFLRGHELQGFWQYNKSLLLRFLTAQLFAHVLFVGLVIALVALEQLFGLDVPDRLYGRTWAVTAILFGTLYFLGGVPRALGELEHDASYPAPLKVLAQYILLPIVGVYLVILTAYLGKILITRVWPSGWIGYLVSSVSLLGVLSLLLLFPIQHRQENRWVVTYGRLLYVALLPSLGMLLVAVGKRVDQYGITENRYFLMVLAVWLGVLCIVYLVTRSRDIRWIPTTLCAVALVTSFGPWDAYHVARRDQLGRLRDILARNQMLADGVAVAAPAPVDFGERREMSAVLSYLLQTHGARSVRELMPTAWAALDPPPGPRATRYDDGQDLAALLLDGLDVDFVDRWQQSEVENRVVTFGTTTDAGDLVDVAGWGYLMRLPPTPGPPTVPTPRYSILYDGEHRTWTLRGPGPRVLLTIGLDEVIAAVEDAPGTSTFFPHRYPVVLESAEPRWKLLIYSLVVDSDDGERLLRSIDARLLFDSE